MRTTVWALAVVLVLCIASPPPAAQAVELVAIPPHLGQGPLAQALAAYRALSDAGGWPDIAAGPTLRRGDVGERVSALRTRLAREGYLWAGGAGASDFDAAVEAAVREFQRRHGLEKDGIVGRETLAALNVPAGSRAKQIELNLARLRALPARLGDPYVVVNLAAQQLETVQDGAVPLVSRVVVGKPSTPTPTLASRIVKVIFNPPWNVPASIARNEVLPELLHDPEHLLAQNMVIVDRYTDPHGLEIDWASAPPGQFEYRLRQLPGPGNALGRIKFEFSNPYTVYLHDTPAKRLFERARRTFSHGCMRIERADELAALLLKEQGWAKAEIELTLAQVDTREVLVEQPVSLWVLYLTAFIEASGALHFREDIYGWDARGRIFEELGAKAPEATGRTAQRCLG